MTYEEQRKERTVAESIYYLERIELLKSKKEIYLDRLPSKWHLAICYTYENKVEEAKKMFDFEAKKNLLSYQIYKENLYPNLVKHEYPPFKMEYPLVSAILCDNSEILNKYAGAMEYCKPGVISYPLHYHIYYSFKHLLLHEYEKVTEHLEEMYKLKRIPAYIKGLQEIVQGILEKDDSVVNEGISNRIKIHKKDNKGSLFYDYSIEATAFAKLGIMYGLSPDVSSPFIHKGLLEKTEGIEYEGIEEITNALEEANRKAGSLGSKISSWFKK